MLSFLKRLWRGELSLPFVFWVLWVGVHVIFYLPILIIDAQDPSNWINLSEQEKIVFGFSSYASGIWWVGFAFLVDKTAKNYRGLKIWQYLARFCVLFTFFYAIKTGIEFILYYYFNIEI